MWHNIENYSAKVHLGLRQNSFMALTAVMKLFWVYLAPYSLFFSTARTEEKTGQNISWFIQTKSLHHCNVRDIQTFFTFDLNGLSLRQTLLCWPYQGKLQIPHYSSKKLNQLQTLRTKRKLFSFSEKIRLNNEYKRHHSHLLKDLQRVLPAGGAVPWVAADKTCWADGGPPGGRCGGTSLSLPEVE